jgi:hypothetical protein
MEEGITYLTRFKTGMPDGEVWDRLSGSSTGLDRLMHYVFDRENL